MEERLEEKGRDVGRKSEGHEWVREGRGHVSVFVMCASVNANMRAHVQRERMRDLTISKTVKKRERKGI